MDSVIMRELINLILGMSRFNKRLLMLGVDSLIFSFCAILPYLLLEGLKFENIVGFIPLLFLVGFSSLLVSIKLGLYRAIVRYVGDQALITVLKLCLFSTGIYSIAIYAGMNEFKLILPVLYFTMLVITIGGSRFIVRLYVQQQSRKTRKKVIIYGAEDMGIQLNRALTTGREYEAVCFLEDRKSMLGTELAGLTIYPPEELPSILLKTGATQIFLAMPEISKSRLSEIIEVLESYLMRVRIIPSLNDIVTGAAKIEEVRDIEIEDLLGREPVEPDLQLLEKCIKNKVVLVTGAGGSIGSELSRQIALQQPKMLLMLDNCEFGLYSIEREVIEITLANWNSNSNSNPSREHQPIVVKALLGSVKDSARMTDIIKTFQVDTIYHAAAFKHVPIVEKNVVDGVQNNTIGTYNIAQIALENKVGTFVLVSTDKAVRPTNVMGASKRLAELVLQGLAQQAEENKSNTIFCMVRFGNVLGSSGSVVPLFRDQIKKGGPVTITHPEMIRYFMTIPEAAQLVIQAGGLAEGGDVFVLDMGEPVKIADLAKKLIRLMGLEVKNEDNPNGDIELEFTGLRPGEKLFEELLIGDNVLGTTHPRIMSAQELSLKWDQIEDLLKDLTNKLDSFDCVAVRDILLNCETGYRPNHDICDLVWLEQTLKQATQVSSGAKIYNI